VLLDAAVGLGFVVVALVLVRAPIALRVWWAAVGAAWWLGGMEPFRLVHQGVLVGALVCYPTGRPRGRGQSVLLGIGGLMALGPLGQAGSAVGFLMTAALGTRGLIFARLAAFMLGLWLAGSFLWSSTWPSSYPPSQALVGYEVILLFVAFTLPLGLWVDTRRRASLADQVLADDDGGLSGLEAALRRALGSRTLILTRDGDNVVVEGLGSVEAETAAAVYRAVSLTVAHEHATAAAARRLHELEAARMRLLNAADAERARAVDRLHDQLSVLRHCHASLAEFPDIAHEVEAAEADIERIVAGLAPEDLGGGGIGSALASLCARHPSPVRLEVDEHARGSLGAEAALFYVCSEALANTAKHARADSVVVKLEAAGDCLVLTVTDDGVGGADSGGTGLENLMDRLVTIGGSLTIESPKGLGTRLVARVPSRARA
jgi:signal transduction histidine kinase